MWSFKKEAHKLATIGEITSVSCGSEFAYSGGKGIYFRDIDLGSDTGIVYFNFESGGQPTRFVVNYDSADVIDSLYGGTNMNYTNPPDYNCAEDMTPCDFMVGQTFSEVYEKVWDGVQFINNGNDQDIEVLQADLPVLGDTALGGVSSGWFVKPDTSPQEVKVIVTELYSTTSTVADFCVLQPIAASIIQDDFQEEGDTLCTTCATITVHLKEEVSFLNNGSNVDIGLNQVTIPGHNLGDIGEHIMVYYDWTVTALSYLSVVGIRGLRQNTNYELEVIDANTLEFVNLDINSVGAGEHTFTPVSQNKRVEFTISGDVGGSYSDVLTLCPGGGTDITTDIIDQITETKTYQFGVDGVKQSGSDNFSNTITVNVYDDDTNVLDDTYTLTRTHNNTSC